MNKKKIIIHFLIAAMMLLASGCGKSEKMILKNLAYDEGAKEARVYIKENEAFVPYLVLTSDYSGDENVLLLREYVLPELRQYEEHGEFWAQDEYGSYYENSSIDEFLNTDFLSSLSNEVKENIVDSEIEVTDKESYTEWNYKTHEINRKIFLLSAVELGIEGVDGSTTAKEGMPLDYFYEAEYVTKVAAMEQGTSCPYWTRTPQLWEKCTVVMVGVEAVGSSTADICAGVRPAFCLSGQTTVKESSEVIEGECVYIIDLNDPSKMVHRSTDDTTFY